MIIMSKRFNKNFNLEYDEFSQKTKRFFRLCENLEAEISYIERPIILPLNYMGNPQNDLLLQIQEYYGLVKVTTEKYSEIIPLPVFCKLMYNRSDDESLIEIRKLIETL